MNAEDHPTTPEPEPKALMIDEAYDMIGRFGKYQMLVCVSSLITMTTFMMYVFSIPLSLIFPRITGCNKPGNDSSLCLTAKEACEHNVTRVYENEHLNYASEFDLVCDDFSATTIALSFIIGNLIGSLLFSTISDNFGRLRVLLTGQIGAIVCLLIIVIAGDYHVTVIVSGMCGFMVAASGTPTYAFAYDSSHADTIKFHGTFINLSFALGEIIIALTMSTGMNWRTVYLLMCLWISLFFIIRTQLVEPPKFLMSKNRIEEATQNLKYIAEVNGKALPSNFALSNSASESSKLAANCSDIVKVLAEKQTLCKLLMCMMLYFSSGYVYFGISMNIQRYKGNVYVNAIINGVVEVVAVFFSGISMSNWGVRFPLGLSFSISGTFMLLLGTIEGHPVTTSVFVALGKFGISGCFNFIYVIVGEIFPTSVKNTALGLCLIADRLGSILGPIVGLNPTVFQVGSALLCTICVIIVYHLPLKSASAPTREINMEVKA